MYEITPGSQLILHQLQADNEFMNSVASLLRVFIWFFKAESRYSYSVQCQMYYYHVWPTLTHWHTFFGQWQLRVNSVCRSAWLHHFYIISRRNHSYTHARWLVLHLQHQNLHCWTPTCPDEWSGCLSAQLRSFLCSVLPNLFIAHYHLCELLFSMIGYVHSLRLRVCHTIVQAYMYM